MFHIPIGTRGSPLALAQAEETRRRLCAATGQEPGAFPLHVIRTSGDAITDQALSLAGGKGLFTKEIDTALLEGRIALAVHSAKDLPTTLPEGLIIAGCWPREDVCDALILSKGNNLEDLPEGARIGSTSLRRTALLKRLRPDLSFGLLRGNVGTRLQAIQAGTFDATILALAGLRRLGLEHHASVVLDAKTFPPAPGQGAIALVAREQDVHTLALIHSLADMDTFHAVQTERAFLRALDGSCRTPIAAYAKVSAGNLTFHGLVLRPDGSQARACFCQGSVSEASALGHEAGEGLRKDLPADFFAE
jgi:hydroxymethylbilane synthase